MMNTVAVAPQRKSIAPAPAAVDSNWQAVVERDARLDGVLYYAVRSTGIYCRPSCPSRRPRKENVSFYFEPAAAERAGFRACLRCRPREVAGREGVETARRICEYVEQNLDSRLTIGLMQKTLGLSAHQVQRTFRQVVGIGVAEYIQMRRLAAFKAGLRFGMSVAEATYEAGFGSSSRVYEGVNSRLGMTPAAYRSGAPGVVVRYAITDSPLGKVLVAATDKGICKVAMGGSVAELEAELKGELRMASFEPADQRLRQTVQQVVAHLEGKQPHLDLPTDVRGTAFQRLVWRELQKIPYGATRTYADVARAVGMPRAHRAVARACATNPTALVVPCHRVVRTDGGMGGYRWGIERKRKLLERERAR